MSHKMYYAQNELDATIGSSEADPLAGLEYLVTDGYEFAGEDLAKLRQHVVYVWIAHDSTVLYIGKSSTGLSRPFAQGHHKIDDELVDNAKTLKVYTCRSAEDATALERKLIELLRPTRNQRMRSSLLRRRLGLTRTSHLPYARFESDRS